MNNSREEVMNTTFSATLSLKNCGQTAHAVAAAGAGELCLVGSGRGVPQRNRYTADSMAITGQLLHPLNDQW
jgi:hypothetical protein